MEAQKTGKLINYLRTKKGLTQKELAQQINVSDKAVSKWERGDGCPDVAILPNLAAVLETDVDSLLNGEIKRRELTEEEVQKLLAEANKQNGWDKINKQFLKNKDARVLIYDFKRPSLFSKYDLRKICNIFEVLCENLRSELVGSRKDLLDIHIASVDELTNEEFLRSVPQRTFFYSYEYYDNSGFAVEVDPTLGKLLLKQDCKKFPELTQTDKDCLYVAYIKDFTKMLQNIIYANTDKSIPFEEFEKKLTFDTLLPWSSGENPGDMCVLVTLEVKTDSYVGMMNVQFHYAYFLGMCRKMGLFGGEGPRLEVLTDIKTKPVENNLFVEFGRFLPDSVDFEPGTILLTQKKFGEALNVVVENEVLYGGEVVCVDEKYGVRIIEVKQGQPLCYDEEHYVALRLGACHVDKDDIAKIGEGTVFEVDNYIGDAIYIIKDGKCIARGEIVIVDNIYGVRIID